MPAFAEEEHVKAALQKAELGGSTDTEYVEPAIHAASDWLARQTNGHWFDSKDIARSNHIDDAARTASDVVCDLPSSPHAQDRRLISPVRNARYPVTVAGRYAEIPLPHLYVSTLNKLEVRDRDGGVTDWVADSSFTEGRGEEYYLQTRGQNSYGRTYLYLDARQVGARVNFDRLLTLDYDYGLDYDTTAWDDVLRGVANLAAAELIDEDNVLAQVPDSGQLIGVDTQHQNLINAAEKYLRPYMSAMGDNR